MILPPHFFVGECSFQIAVCDGINNELDGVFNV